MPTLCQMRTEWPLCKCGRRVAYYGVVGGYSKRCAQCNADAAKRQREERARRKSLTMPVTEHMSPYEEVLGDLRRKRDHLEAAIKALENL